MAEDLTMSAGSPLLEIIREKAAKALALFLRATKSKRQEKRCTKLFHRDRKLDSTEAQPNCRGRDLLLAPSMYYLAEEELARQAAFSAVGNASSTLRGLRSRRRHDP